MEAMVSVWVATIACIGCLACGCLIGGVWEALEQRGTVELCKSMTDNEAAMLKLVSEAIPPVLILNEKSLKQMESQTEAIRLHSKLIVEQMMAEIKISTEPMGG